MTATPVRHEKQTFVTAESPFGDVTVAFWGDKIIVATTVEQEITINRVPYTLRAEFELKRGEVYDFVDWHTGLSRADKWTRTDDVSRAAIDKVRAELPVWLNEYVKSHDMLVIAGYLNVANNEIVRKLAAVEDARKKLAAAQLEYEAALSAEADIKAKFEVIS